MLFCGVNKRRKKKKKKEKETQKSHTYRWVREKNCPYRLKEKQLVEKQEFVC
jgi:hypothetical protein